MDLPPYVIGEEIGDGELRFYRARRPGDGRPVLLRTAGNGAGPRARARTLLEREFGICRDLGVDGVLTALDFVVRGNRAALVFADAPGVPLDRALDRHGGALPLATALAIGGQIAATLSALHRRDLVHRDLRPANVLYDEASGKVRLTGLGRASQVPRETWKVAAPDQLEGDPAYLAPEATGRLNRQLDYRADLYALGVVLFEMLTGRPPFDDTDPVALVHAHIACQPPDPGELRRGIPAAVSAIVGKLLAKAAEERYQSGLGLGHDLERCLADLRSGGDIRPFEPGERDVAERFELPQTLFGREAEIRWLEEALAVVAPPRSPQGDGAATERTAVRLVAGYSGVGKTSLVEEIRLSVLRRRGRFASGRFDPNPRGTPYGGILGALRGLVLRKLGEKPPQTEAWARRLVDELGPNLGVVTEALPELLSLVGEPPAVPEVPAENVRNRFHAAVGRFLATIDGISPPRSPPRSPPCSPPCFPPGDDGPLVLFLDDLQWVDPASVELLLSLLTGDAGAFLLLGAYRDNEVDEDHHLAHAVAELRSRDVDVDTLRLPPLAEPALTQLVAAALRAPAAEAAPLAELVYRKTAGNPFFARAFLRTLHQRRLLHFTAAPPDDASPHWAWDLEAIAALEATENVIELVARQLTELPSACRRTLAAASVLGKEVDVETLTAVCEADAEGNLIEACRRGLLVKVGASQRYAFVHDRVREGAGELLRAGERAELHLRIGRLLRDRAAPGRAASAWAGEGPRDVFEIADHLNLAAHLLTDPAERRELVRLNAEAGRRARASGAFPVAFAYLSRALEHLGVEAAGEDAGPWHQCYELTRTLHAEAAEAASLAGDFEAAERLCDLLRRNARSLLDAVPAYETKIYVLHARREEEAAIRLSLDVLGRFGVEIPRHPEASDLKSAVQAAGRAVETVLGAVARGGVQQLPVKPDPAQLAVARLLMRTAVIASWAWIRLCRLTICRLAEIAATHDVGPITPIAYVLMAEVRCGELEDFAGGRRLGELALELADQPEASGLAPATRILFDFLVGGRLMHPAVLEQRLAEDFRRGVECGDLQLAGGAGFHRAIAGLLTGTELAKTETSALECHARVRGFGQQMLAGAIERLARLAGVLLGRGTVEEAVDTARVPPDAAASIRARVIGVEMMVRFLLRERETALATARESLSTAAGMVPTAPTDFYRCLDSAARDSAARDGGADEAQLDACQARLERQARAAPEIYEHRSDLVRAHRRRAAGAADEALALYDQAIDGARKNGFPQEAALGCELAAELCLPQADPGDAVARERPRRTCAKRFGATAGGERGPRSTSSSRGIRTSCRQPPARPSLST